MPKISLMYTKKLVALRGKELTGLGLGWKEDFSLCVLLNSLNSERDNALYMQQELNLKIASVYKWFQFYSWCLVWFLGASGYNQNKTSLITVLSTPPVYDPKHLLWKDIAMENKSPCFVEHHGCWYLWVWEEVPWRSRISLIGKTFLD